MIKFITLGTSEDSEELLESINRFVRIEVEHRYEVVGMYVPAMLLNMNKRVEEANLTYYINSDMPIISDSKLKKYVKQCIKKLISWYLKLVQDKQVEFNGCVVRSINEQMELINVLYAQTKNLEKRVEDLEIKLIQLKKD